MPKTHHLMFRLQKPTSLPRWYTFIQKNEGGEIARLWVAAARARVAWVTRATGIIRLITQTIYWGTHGGKASRS